MTGCDKQEGAPGKKGGRCFPSRPIPSHPIPSRSAVAEGRLLLFNHLGNLILLLLLLLLFVPTYPRYARQVRALSTTTPPLITMYESTEEVAVAEMHLLPSTSVATTQRNDHRLTRKYMHTGIWGSRYLDVVPAQPHLPCLPCRSCPQLKKAGPAREQCRKEAKEVYVQLRVYTREEKNKSKAGEEADVTAAAKKYLVHSHVSVLAGTLQKGGNQLLYV